MKESCCSANTIERIQGRRMTARARALPSIPAATRHHIREVADRLGYRPNARVSELMGQIRQNRSISGLSETVAMYWSDAAESDVRNFSHLRRMEAAVQTRLACEGFGLDLFYNDAANTPATVERILRTRGIRGVILAPLIHLTHRHLHWRWDLLSVVIAGSGIWRPDFNRVRFNHFEDIMLILHHLHAGATKKVALATDAQVEVRSQHAMTGSFWARVPAQTRRMESVFTAKVGDHDRFEKWLTKLKPEILIVASPHVFGWVGDHYPEMEIVVTSDVLAPQTPGLRGIRQDYASLGSVAAEKLMGQMSLNQTGIPENPHQIYLRGEWVEPVTKTRPVRERAQSVAE